MQFLNTNRQGFVTFYHGTPVKDLKRFDITKARSTLDYGKGIYFTTNEEQAKEWSLKHDAKEGAVYEVKIDLSRLKIKTFTSYTDEFINTFCFCRVGLEEMVALEEYDAVYGLMLDHYREKIFKFTNDYVYNGISAATVRANISAFEERDQLCIKKQEVLDSIPIHRIMYTKRIDAKRIKYTQIINMSKRK